MFTGIIEEVGEISGIRRGSQSIEIEIKAEEILTDIQLGDSIATNGVCLTVTSFTENRFTVDVMPETLRKSSLNDLQVGDKVNLERALRLKDRLGGHLVSGHIDGVGEIKQKRREDNAVLFTISLPAKLSKYVIPKGSIAVDGISLTIAELANHEFVVSIIPHTAKGTTLNEKKVGDIVNLEVDLIGKYVERMLNVDNEAESNEVNNDSSKVGLNLLQKKGFL